MEHELVSMKLSKQSRQEATPQAVESQGPEYPYGLRLSLDEDSLEKLGIEELLEAGKSVHVVAKAEIVSVSHQESAHGKPHRSVELQITDLAVHKKMPMPPMGRS